MTKFHKNILRMTGMLLPAAVAILSLASCSDDDNNTPAALDSPEVTISYVTSSTIDFTWTAVEGARQYSYSVTAPDGKRVKGGVTQARSVTATKLQPITTYTIEVTAYPTVVGSASMSEASSASARTTFYDRVDNAEGTYTSCLLNADGESWTATLDEDRTAEDYEEDTFGIFTLNSFYNRSAGTLVFAVNKDNTITILNATDRNSDGWAGVKTGRPQTAYKTIYIDESSSVFDFEKGELTYTAKFEKSAAPQTEVFNW